jgi:hypothetical protein
VARLLPKWEETDVNLSPPVCDSYGEWSVASASVRSGNLAESIWQGSLSRINDGFGTMKRGEVIRYVIELEH